VTKRKEKKRKEKKEHGGWLKVKRHILFYEGNS
jgi:hypothetical protein